MAKLRILSGREVCEILKRHGFVEIRQRGSHIVMQATKEGRTRTTIVPAHRELRTGTLLSIVRQAGIPRAEIEA